MITLPLIDVKTDPLDALLYVFGLRLSYLANQQGNETFHELIKDKEVAIAFISGNIARYYRFAGGKIGQAAGIPKHVDLTIEFVDSMTGVKLLTQGDAASFMTAVQEEKVKITGDYKLILWFVTISKHAIKLSDTHRDHLDKLRPYADKVNQLLQTTLAKIKK